MVARVCAVVVIAIGGGVLVGWALDNATLKSVFPGSVTMKVNTASGLLLCGVALTLLSCETVAKPIRLGVATLALMAIVPGALSLGEDIFGWNLGIDQWLFRDTAVAVETSSPGRMSPSAAFCFFLEGSALAVAAMAGSQGWRRPIVSALGAAVIGIGGLALFGHLSGELLNFRLWDYAGMAAHTAAGFALGGIALLALVKSEGGLAWALDKIITLGFAVAVAIMLTAAGVSFAYTSRLRESAKRVSHTQEVLKEIEDVRADLAALESSQRGYLILGDERLLTSRDRDAAELRERVRNIRGLTADDFRQQRRLDRLEPSIAQRTDFGERNIIIRRQHGFAVAQQMLATGTGIALTANINQLLQAMRAEEYALLVAQQKQSASSSTITFLLLPLGVFLSLTILSLGLFFLNASVDERVRAEEAVRESEDLFSKAFRLSPDCVAIVRMVDRRLIKANEAVCRLWSSTPDKVIGKPTEEFSNWLNEEERLAFMQMLQEKGECLNYETTLGLNDGRLVRLNLSSRIVTLHGEACILSVMHDITENKQAEEKIREQLAELLRWQRAMLGREERVQKLKAEVNDLLNAQGQSARYAGPTASLKAEVGRE